MQIHELTNVAPAGLGSTEYAAVDNGNSTRKLNLSALVWRPGQSVTITNGPQAAGAWTNTTTLRFHVPISRPIVASSVSVSGNIYIRSSAGYSGAVDLSGSGITATAEINASGVTVTVVYATAPSYSAANVPAVVGLTLTMTFS